MRGVLNLALCCLKVVVRVSEGLIIVVYEQSLERVSFELIQCGVERL